MGIFRQFVDWLKSIDAELDKPFFDGRQKETPIPEITEAELDKPLFDGRQKETPIPEITEAERRRGPHSRREVAEACRIIAERQFATSREINEELLEELARRENDCGPLSQVPPLERIVEDQKAWETRTSEPVSESEVVDPPLMPLPREPETEEPTPTGIPESEELLEATRPQEDEELKPPPTPPKRRSKWISKEEWLKQKQERMEGKTSGTDSQRDPSTPLRGDRARKIRGDRARRLIEGRYRKTPKEKVPPKKSKAAVEISVRRKDAVAVISESSWWACEDPSELLPFLGDIERRKFACACVRAVEKRITTQRFVENAHLWPIILNMAERMSYRKSTPQEVAQLEGELLGSWRCRTLRASRHISNSNSKFSSCYSPTDYRVGTQGKLRFGVHTIHIKCCPGRPNTFGIFSTHSPMTPSNPRGSLPRS